MTAIQPDFDFSQIAAFPEDRARFRRDTGLTAALTDAHAGGLDGQVGEVVEITCRHCDPGEALWIIYPVAGGVSFKELPFPEVRFAATIADALECIAFLVNGEPA